MLAIHKSKCITLLTLYISLLDEMMFVYLLPRNLQSTFLRTFQRKTCAFLIFMNLLTWASTKCEKQLNQPQRSYNFHLSFSYNWTQKGLFLANMVNSLFALHCEVIQRESVRRNFEQSFYRNG